MINYLTKTHLVAIVLMAGLFSCSTQKDNYPDPKTNPESPLMLSGDWFEDSHDIAFDALPKVPTEHVVVSDVLSKGGVNQHNYLIHHDNRFWIMWSDGPGVEDRVGQVVKYATSEDGLNWTTPKLLTPYPPNSGPDSPHYNTRTEEGYRWISRGFWVYKGDLLALASLDEAAGFFGESLELRAFRWDKEADEWMDFGLIHDNTINNFPPKQLPTGEWLMSRRTYDYKEKGVEFFVGGVESFDQWKSFPVLGTNKGLTAEEPYWWILPNGKDLMALFRDNKKSGYLYRSFSIDNGSTWSLPVQTNFPDATSKFHGIRLSDGRYVLVSNPKPKKRDPITISISNDGMVFDKMFYLTGGRHIDYPHVLQHDNYLYIAFAGSKKQKIEVLRVLISDLDNMSMSKESAK